MSDPKSLEELHKELMDWAGMSPPSATSPSGSTSQGGPIVVNYTTSLPSEWAVTEYGALVPVQPVAAPSGATTHRVIPDKCEYARGMLIPGAPKVPMSPRTADDHPDLLEAAQRKIRRWVASNYRTWPCCGPSSRNVDISFEYDHDPDLGPIMLGFFSCSECSR